ncbi:F-box/kelch-repeat protein At3g23880-like [Silene latifolia]|uniref:F-box/kelch-repeat protein At3g23880-like n=1 Tax=Silene latifolia TaxID=37657 RepID=UPI003D774A41
MRSSKKPTSSSNLPYIPPEILIQIFPTLPVKTLLRFRCVCKSWRSIIDNPDFVHMHFQHSRINSENNTSNKLLLSFEGMGCSEDVGCVLTVRHAETLGKIDRIFRTHSGKYRIIGSCNGLILVGLYAPHGHLKQLRLWNPCIRKSFLFPTCPLRLDWIGDFVWYLFGFAPRSQDYKVIGFAPDYIRGVENGIIYFAVYTLSNQEWTVRKDPLNVAILNNHSRRGLFDYVSTAVFFRGAGHWLGKIDNHRNAFTHLVSFDFDQEKLTFLELPFTCEEKGSLRFLFFLGGSLAVLGISKVSSSIWMLEQDNQKGPWTLSFSGNSSEDGYEVFELCHGKLEKVFYCESDGGYFICGNKIYNIGSCQVQPFKKYMSSHLKLEKYWESLVLFKGYRARDLRSSP